MIMLSYSDYTACGVFCRLIPRSARNAAASQRRAFAAQIAPWLLAMPCVPWLHSLGERYPTLALCVLSTGLHTNKLRWQLRVTVSSAAQRKLINGVVFSCLTHCPICFRHAQLYSQDK